MSFFSHSPIGKSAYWTDAREWAVKSISQALIRCTDERYANLVFNSLYKYIDVDSTTYKAKEKTWTSMVLKQLAGKIMENKANTQLAQIRAIFQNSGMGFMFEYNAHRKLRKSKDQRLVAEFGTKNIVSLKMEINKVVLIRTIEDIAQLKKGEYGLPTISNFPLIDAIYNNILINYTIADKHSCAVDKLSEIKSKIVGQYASYYLLFVVPTDVISIFKPISMNAKGIKPYQDSFTNVIQCVTTDDKPASQDTLCRLCGWKGSKRGIDDREKI